MTEGLLTVQEAADMARCDPRTIRYAISSGELRALFSSRWLVQHAAVLEWMGERARQRVSRPRAQRRASRPAQRRDSRVASVHRLAALQQGDST